MKMIVVMVVVVVVVVMARGRSKIYYSSSNTVGNLIIILLHIRLFTCSNSSIYSDKIIMVEQENHTIIIVCNSEWQYN